MITEDYVSFEIAKLLKEKGFTEYTLGYYLDDKDKLYFDRFSDDWNSNHVGYISAPTLQMAMKWLREVHNQTIVLGIRVEDPISGIINRYTAGIWYIPRKHGGAFCYTSPPPYNDNDYQSFEEACEAAIKYCLENLI